MCPFCDILVTKETNVNVNLNKILANFQLHNIILAQAITAADILDFVICFAPHIPYDHRKHNLCGLVRLFHHIKNQL